MGYTDIDTEGAYVWQDGSTDATLTIAGNSDVNDCTVMSAAVTSLDGASCTSAVTRATALCTPCIGGDCGPQVS